MTPTANDSKTHGPIITIQGRCATCEFLDPHPVEPAWGLCRYVEPRRSIGNNELITPRWCPLLQEAYENFAAEIDRKGAK